MTIQSERIESPQLADLTEKIEAYGLTPQQYEDCLHDAYKKANHIIDLDWQEIVDKYGLGIHYDTLRKATQTIFGGAFVSEYFKAKRANQKGDTYLAELRAEKIEVQKERQKFYDYRNAYNKIVRERSRQEELNEILVEAIESSNLPRLNYIPCQISGSDNDLLVSLNDLHYGAHYENYWGAYNSDICKEMMSKYLDSIIHIAATHQSENCIIWENGDAISGSIHRSIQVTNKENVIEQITGVSELIAEFIAELSRHFKTVRFVSVSGNHSRLNPNKDDSLVEERLDDLIEWYLSARLQGFDNVVIESEARIDPTMYLINIRGLNYLGCHGDFDASQQKVQALQTMAKKPIYAVLSGHLHHNKIDAVQGIKTIMAGSFMGVDSYCVQKRIYGRPEQLICVVDDGGVRCSYDIAL